jgi:hypothetical protein
MQCAVQDYRPLIVDATNISKSKGKKIGKVRSVVDTITNETSDCVETVRELDDHLLKVSGRKRRHATNISKSKGKKTGKVRSVVDTITDETSECGETVRELDDCLLKVPGRKRRHADSLTPQIGKANVSGTLQTCTHRQKSSRQEDTAAANKNKQKRHKDTRVTSVHKQTFSQHQDTPGASEHEQKCLQHKDTTSTCVHKRKCSQHEEDTSVIILGSDDDDEVEIIDSDPKPRLGPSVKTYVDPKPQSDHSSITDDVIDTLHKRKPETVIIDLCSPSLNSKYPAATQRSTGREDKKTSGSEHALKEYVSVLGDGFHTSRNRPHDVPSVSSHTAYRGLVPFASPASASSTCDSAANSGFEKMQDCEVIFISSEKGGDKMNSASVCGSGLQKHDNGDARKRLQAIDNRMDQTGVPSSSAYGSNLYNPHPDTVRRGLRPIVIDGSNVAMG